MIYENIRWHQDGDIILKSSYRDQQNQRNAIFV